MTCRWAGRRAGSRAGCLRVEFAAEGDGAGHAILVVQHDLDGELHRQPAPQLRQVDVRVDAALRDRLRAGPSHGRDVLAADLLRDVEIGQLLPATIAHLGGLALGLLVHRGVLLLDAQDRLSSLAFSQL